MFARISDGTRIAYRSSISCSIISINARHARTPWRSMTTTDVRTNYWRNANMSSGIYTPDTTCFSKCACLLHCYQTSWANTAVAYQLIGKDVRTCKPCAEARCGKRRASVSQHRSLYIRAVSNFDRLAAVRQASRHVIAVQQQRDMLDQKF